MREVKCLGVFLALVVLVAGAPGARSRANRRPVRGRWTDTANQAADGAEDGMIGLQVHAGQRWAAGKSFRFRNLAVEELE